MLCVVQVGYGLGVKTVLVSVSNKVARECMYVCVCVYIYIVFFVSYTVYIQRQKSCELKTKL